MSKLQHHIQTYGLTAPVINALPELLEWLADTHWDVARPLGLVLATFDDELRLPVQAILQGVDSGHKFGVISLLLSQLPPHTLSYWFSDLQRIAAEEDDEGASEIARSILQRASTAAPHQE